MAKEEVSLSNLLATLVEVESLLHSLSESAGADGVAGLSESLTAVGRLKEVAEELIQREAVDVGLQEVSEALKQIETALRNAASIDHRLSPQIEQCLQAVSLLGSAAQTYFRQQRQSEKDQAWQEIFRHPRPLPGVEARPAFIIGYRRSGTTLLAWLLNSHPDLAALPENPLCHRLFSPPGPSSSDRYPVAVQLQTAVEELGENRSAFYDRMASFINEVFLGYARRQGKRRWISKELFLSGSLDLLDLAFGYSSQFLYIARHGLDAAISASKRFGARSGAPLQSLDIRTYLQEWVENNQASLDFMERNPDRVQLLRYEDFVTKPEESARQVFQFLGESWQPDIFEVMQSQAHPPLGDNRIYQTGGQILADRMGRWKEWPPALLRQLERLAGPMLERLGYAKSLL